jgi:O-antigen/teichoic acid export membrane protein
MSITRTILKNTFWQILGKFITAVLGIVSIKMITGYFNTDLYGQYTTLFDYVSFFAIAADFGLYTIGVREMAKKEQPIHFIFGNILSLRLILTIFILSLGGIVAQFIPSYADTLIPQNIWLVSLITALFLINGTLTSVLQFNYKMLAANISMILGKIISVAYIGIIIYKIYPDVPYTGFDHLLYGAVVGNVIMIAITAYYTNKYTPIRPLFDKTYLKQLIKTSAPYALSLVLSTIYFRIDIILLGLLKSLSEAGIYAVPLKLMEILSVIPVFFMNSLLPALTNYIKTNKAKAAQVVEKAFGFLLIIAMPLMIGGVILAFPITFVISSPQFLSGYHCLNDGRIVSQQVAEIQTLCESSQFVSNFALSESFHTGYRYLVGSDLAFKLIIVAVFFSFLNTLFNFSLVALDQQKKLLYINLLGVGFNVTTNLILIPKYGFIGAAVTTIGSEIIILLGTIYYYRQNLPFHFNLAQIIKTMLASLSMGLSLLILFTPSYKLLQNWNILILIPIGIAIYTSMILLTKALTIKQLKELLH